MGAVAPLAILMSAMAALALIAISQWEPLFARIGTLVARFHSDVESAGLKLEPLSFVFLVIGVASCAWLTIVLVLRPDPALALLLLAACCAAAGLAGLAYLKRRRNVRVSDFREQLEGALRTLAGGVRVGLGVRQALVLTSEQSREPSKSEFMRVVGLTNVGVSTLDAFDQLAARMTNTETAILARVIRVQAQTGGDLALVLEGLAGTIRDRRRLLRRASAATAQGRATAWLLGLLPVAVGAFILTQAELRDAMLFTSLGRILLAASLALDLIAILSLFHITRIDP